MKKASYFFLYELVRNLTVASLAKKSQLEKTMESVAKFCSRAGGGSFLQVYSGCD